MNLRNWSRTALAWGCSLTVVLSQTTCAALVQPIRAQRGMVAAAHPLASQAGLSLLQKGGNAVDAAVATAFAISVVEPFSAGIGGGGFLLLRLAETGEIKALDFRERAPLQATHDLYLDRQGRVRPKASTTGHLAVAVPGTVAGLYAVHRQHGQLPWPAVVEPAIQLAQGFTVSDRLAQAIRQGQSRLQQNAAARRIFTPNNQPLPAGSFLFQHDLAHTLRAIAIDPNSFYQGWIAQKIVQDMVANQGLITLKDLQTYKPTWRSPICGPFRQAQICSMPPPSSGGVHLLQMLNLIASLDVSSQDHTHPDWLHVLTEVMKIAYADRAVYLGDPDFVQVPVSELTSTPYAQLRRQEIRADRARPASEVKAAAPEVLDRLRRRHESSDTSHLTVVDRDHNAVSLTFTVNLGFGAGVVTPGTGILLNNEMDDFAVAPGVANAFGLVGGEANAIAPGKVPLSSMTPTIVTENGQLRFATGAPGGSTIITTVLQIVLNILVHRMNAGEAVSAPRLHHQWRPEPLWVEEGGFDEPTLEHLKRRGHRLLTRSGWGNANIILVTPEGTLEGAADPRGEGTAVGY